MRKQVVYQITFNSMEIKDKSAFVTEVSAMILTPAYKEFVESLQKKATIIKEQCFATYFGQELVTENQIYNEKTATAEKIKAYIEIKDMASGLVAGKYLAEFLDELIESGENLIKDAIGGLNSGLTMSVYTETDIMLQKAGAYFQASKFYDEEIEKLKKWKKDDNTLDEPKEE